MIYRCKQEVRDSKCKHYVRMEIDNMGNITRKCVAYNFKYSADLADLQHFIRYHIDMDENACHQSIVIRYHLIDNDEVNYEVTKLHKIIALKNI